jgi:hypothetical protein
MPVLSALGSLGDPLRTVTVKHTSVCRLQLTRVEFKIEFTNIDSPVCLLNVANR